MPSALRAFLHDLIDAVAGAGHADRLHAALDAIGVIVAPDPEPAETESPSPNPAADALPTPDELAAFRAWQASQAAPTEVTGG